MHDDADFLRAILADPFDDAPRLVYADWLEEHAGSAQCPVCRGNRQYSYRVDGGGVRFRNPCDECRGTGHITDHRAARAEFIRVQCELAAYPIEKCDASYPGCTLNPEMNAVVEHNHECPMYRLDKRVDELLLHRNEWFESLLFARPFIGRGFIQAIDCTLAAFMEHAAEIFSKHPVTEVRLTDLVVHQSGGNDTYYMGNLGAFPRAYWRRLEDLKSRLAVHDASSRACVDYGRSLAGLPPLTWPAVRENELSGIAG